MPSMVDKDSEGRSWQDASNPQRHGQIHLAGTPSKVHHRQPPRNAARHSTEVPSWFRESIKPCPNYPRTRSHR